MNVSYVVWSLNPAAHDGISNVKYWLTQIKFEQNAREKEIVFAAEQSRKTLFKP
jgi:hypothetical protein